MAEFSRVRRGGALFFLGAMMFWAPLPLGGALFWAPFVQCWLTCLCFALWGLSFAGKTKLLYARLCPVFLPLVCVMLVLVWAWVQTLPFVPKLWIHPVWSMASEALGLPLSGAVSISPWRTEGQTLLLLSYVMIGVMSYDFALHDRTASRLQNIVIWVVSLYAAYGFLTYLSGTGPREVFLGVKGPPVFVTGTFVLHNSFATFCGIGTLAALGKIVSESSQTIIFHRGARHFFYSLLQYLVGRGLWPVLAFAICFSAVVASASRAGFASVCIGLLCFFLIYGFIVRSGRNRRVSLIFGGIAVIPVIWFAMANGGTLALRFQALFDPAVTDQIRLALWDAAGRMIADSPWLGMGLGTFKDAYPLYATHIFPFVLERAHCDYLEFIAGVGIPAACLWFIAFLYLGGLFLRGACVRRRGAVYPVLGLAVMVQVGLHSAVDFSLQLPPVALLFSVILGIAAAQSLRTQERAGASPVLAHEPRRLYERG